MKKKLLIIASAFVCGLMLTNCGGSGSGSSSNVKKNEYLGNFPKIYADYELAESELMQKAEKESKELMKGGSSNQSKLMKMSEEYEAKEKKMKEQLEADLAAEREKFTGKDVPFSYSDSLKSSNDLFYEITTLKTALDDKGNPMFVFNIKASKDFTVPKYGNLDYTIYLRLIDKDRNPLKGHFGVVIPVATNFQAVNFKVGDVFPEQTRPISVTTPDIANFAGIEFISNNEYKKIIGL